MNDIVSPLFVTYYPSGDSKVGRVIPAWNVLSLFPEGLAFEMDWRAGWVSTQGVQTEATWRVWT